MTADSPEAPPSIPEVPAVETEALDPGTSNSGLDTGFLEAQLLTRNLSARQIEEEAAENDHRRAEKFRDHFERIAIGAMYSIAGALFLVGAVWLWHLVAPSCWHFLTDEHLEKLQNVVTGGVLASVAAGHLKKRLK